jgi:hypothetical protein
MKREFLSGCMRDSKDMAVKYPELTLHYCECSIERIQSRFTKGEYTDIIRQTMDEQAKVLMPVFQDCLTDYQNKIKERSDSTDSDTQ